MSSRSCSFTDAIQSYVRYGFGQQLVLLVYLDLVQFRIFGTRMPDVDLE